MVDKKLIQIWSEGFRATGESGPATLHTTIRASSLVEACRILALTDRSFKLNYNETKMTYWGCRLFDNEADARKTFG